MFAWFVVGPELPLGVWGCSYTMDCWFALHQELQFQS